MQKKIRPDPLIPDHEVLRKIGGGAYGEVWLARGVTGAMRAVKIVYREDFSDERTFEREFEGILRFEPISREHRGFVNILHVGRGDDQSEFYYYVMELGDDAHNEGGINPVEYEPRTLRTDMLRKNGAPLPTNFCIETGKRLAEALSELHERGLTHRDVKPSNVIFVDGKAKLADIGLVAAKDQRTFVGTEGFVPPEGPGSEQADIYGLGKVLYEMATGMDRLQFPELPNESPGDDSRKKWIRLNRTICDICDPRIAKRKIKTGHELATVLGRLQRGRGAPKKIPVYAKISLLLLAMVGLFGSQLWIEKTWGTHIIEGKLEPLPARYVTVKILSTPYGAEVVDADGNSLGPTPATLTHQEVGSRLLLTLRAPGYRDFPLDREVVNQSKQVMVINDPVLSLFSPPKEGQPWSDVLGSTYQPHGDELDEHRSTSHVTEKNWRIFLKETGKNLQLIPIAHGNEKIVAVQEDWAQQYADWLMEKCLEEGYFDEYSIEDLGQNRHLIAEYDRTFPENKLPGEARKNGKILRPFYCLVRPIPYGSIMVDTDPTGAYIYINDIPVGVTPYDERAIPGKIRLRFEYGGRKTLEKTIVLADSGSFQQTFTLDKNKSLTPGQKWTNSLEMKFEPVSDEFMASVWETRTMDFREFLKASKRKADGTILDKDPLVPVVGVTRGDCQAFCEWLTNKERPDFISNDYRYRLPTDAEWSRMTGLVEIGEAPAEREQEAGNIGIFPWGREFPPPARSGNYADISALKLGDFVIPGYEDGFPGIAPVGKFEKNILGLHDLGGNVHEWVSDNYVNNAALGILRGGGWRTNSLEHLEARSRYLVDIEDREDFIGFRVVLAKQGDEEEKEVYTSEEINDRNSD
jgi:serine/threonine protein kinase